MQPETYIRPTDAELRAIYARAHRERALATRDMFRALGRLIARAFAPIATLFAGGKAKSAQ